MPLQVNFLPDFGKLQGFPGARQEIDDIQTKLRWADLADAIQHLMDVVQNQQYKLEGLFTTLPQLYLDFTRERQGLTLFHDQLLTSHIQCIHAEQDRIPLANIIGDLQMERKL